MRRLLTLWEVAYCNWRDENLVWVDGQVIFHLQNQVAFETKKIKLEPYYFLALRCFIESVQIIGAQNFACSFSVVDNKFM